MGLAVVPADWEVMVLPVAVVPVAAYGHTAAGSCFRNNMVAERQVPDRYLVGNPRAVGRMNYRFPG